MQIIVQLQREAAHELQNRQPLNDTTQELMDIAEECKVALEPVHPQIPDPELATYFSVQVADPEIGERIRKRLSGCDCVEAAYIKPLDALP
ncbi:MAG: hypothetical protein IH987_05430 [Planctomycetes bacterium]|nr:hypothetical protein [Planctomycetota bacterium]